MSMTYIWLILSAVFLVIELATVSLCSVWFMVGALVAALTSGLGGPLWLQIVLFLAVSGLCFWLLYPRLKHLIQRNRQPTNADMAIGRICLVSQRIDPLAGTGAVSVDGRTWTARAADGGSIDESTQVRVERIEGVKLIVTPVKQEQLQ